MPMTARRVVDLFGGEATETARRRTELVSREHQGHVDGDRCEVGERFADAMQRYRRLRESQIVEGDLRELDAVAQAQPRGRVLTLEAGHRIKHAGAHPRG